MEKTNFKLGIVIHSNEPETVWNAIRFANFAIQRGDCVKVFLLGRGVDAESILDDRFRVSDELKKFAETGGTILACGTCLKIRNREGTELCPLSTMADLYAMTIESDKVLTF